MGRRRRRGEQGCSDRDGGVLESNGGRPQKEEAPSGIHLEIEHTPSDALLLKGNFRDVLHQFFAHVLNERGQDMTFQRRGLGVVVGPFISHRALVQSIAPIPNIPQVNAAFRNAKLRRPNCADDGVARALGLNKLLQQATILAPIKQETMEASTVEIFNASIVVVARSAGCARAKRGRTSTRGTRFPDATSGRRGGGRGRRRGGRGWWWCWKWLVILLLECIWQGEIVRNNVARERLLGKLLLDAPAEQVVLALFQDFARLGRREIPGTRT